jgi:hypothetical protein
LFAVSEEALQKMINIFVEVANTFAQEVSVKKTKVMVVEKGGEKKIPQITINGTVLEVVDDFVYLGSKESNTGDMSAEVNVRKQRMYAAFNQWSGRILMNKSLSLHLRLSSSISLLSPMVCTGVQHGICVQSKSESWIRCSFNC